MSDLYRKTQAIRLNRGLSIYKQPQGNGRGSPNWYARIYMPIDGRSIHTRTTGTTDQRLAENIAFAFYGDCLVRSRLLHGALLSPTIKGRDSCLRFDRIADQFLAEMEKDAGDDPRRIRNLKDYRGNVIGKGGLATFFGKQDVNSITSDRIREYLQFQIAMSRKKVLAPASQRRTLVTLNVILKFAYEKQLLGKLPIMPKVRMKDNPRPWFERDEYDRLHIKGNELALEALKTGATTDYQKWSELADFIIFMVATFLRPSEWAGLKHSHITIIEGKERFLEILVTDGKTGSRRSVSMPEAISAYRRIIARTGSDSCAYIFKPDYLNRQTAKERMRDAFEELMQKAGLAFSLSGKKRTMYSLRHTSLMLRMTEGDANILHLAQNAGTSIEMLQRFYLRELSPRKSVKNIQSMKS